MDDSCAVCAEPLEWVAFGPCGHRDICSTCVSRLRFICNDRRCCICKAESDCVFVTKALGEYTEKFNDFHVFSSESREGRVGSYWFHLDTHAIFDDPEQYKMVKAMCRLSCSMCDRVDGDQGDSSRRKGGFRSIDQLKGHLFHQHRLVMCRLCLEGRKVFICEQKLYTRGQLNQHIHTGDSEVDGNESERGGFMGHPICEFCRAPFYGDNELYTHMSTDHFTCHFCLRQHPGQYDYYKNYSDLEAHFRREHFLCEDEACLAKKFVVFLGEADMKRHTMSEHGGNMSRSRRNSALQIPTSFRYRRPNEQDRRRGRGQVFFRDFSEDQVAAIEASLLETGVSESPEDAPAVDGSPLQPPPEWPNISSGEGETRYRRALSHNQTNRYLGESSFPPLPLAAAGPKAKPDSDISRRNTMADHLRRKNGRDVAISLVKPATGWPGRRPAKPTVASGSGGGGPDPQKTAVSDDMSAARNTPTPVGDPLPPNQTTPSYAQVVPTRSHSSSSRRKGSSSSPPRSPVARNSPIVSDSDFPPVSSTRTGATQAGLPGVEDVQMANRSLVERMRASLGFDDTKYADFRGVSVKYRQGAMDTREYLGQVQRYGLLHLVHDLARLLPDLQKQNELTDAYIACFSDDNFRKNRAGKGKTAGGADGAVETVGKLIQRSTDEEVEVLSKDGYRGKCKKATVAPQEATWGGSRGQTSGSGGAAKPERGESRGRGRSVWENRGGQRLIGGNRL